MDENRNPRFADFEKHVLEDVTYMPAGQFDEGYYVRRTQGGTTEYRGPYRTRLGAWLRITNHSLECVRRVYPK